MLDNMRSVACLFCYESCLRRFVFDTFLLMSLIIESSIINHCVIVLYLAPKYNFGIDVDLYILG